MLPCEFFICLESIELFKYRTFMNIFAVLINNFDTKDDVAFFPTIGDARKTLICDDQIIFLPNKIKIEILLTFCARSSSLFDYELKH